MTVLDKRLTRAQALKAGAVTAASLYLAACGGDESSSDGGQQAANIAWLTWADHYASDQLKAVRKQTGIRARPSLISDNTETLLKLKQGGARVDIASADALWVPRFHKEGLTDAFDLAEIQASKQLYPAAREFSFWQADGQYLAYPVGWSTQQLYYNTDKVKTKPDSWQALADPKYRNRIVLVNSATQMMAVAGLATGAKEPFVMNDAEIAAAKDFLAAVKPNVLKLAAQATDTNAALIDGSAWIAFNNLGTELLVKDAGGPPVEVAFPSEGVTGFIDGEQIVKSSKNKDRFGEFMEATQQAEWIAANFLKNGRPLFNEKAYKLLVNQGEQERADRLLYNQPDKAAEMILQGPSGNEQAYVDAFNEVFGA